MNGKQMKERIQHYLSKLGAYKYPALIILAGAVLMLWPQKEEPITEEQPASVVHTQEADLEERLEEVLGKMEGVGKVTVMLTLESSGVTSYQQDIQSSETMDRTEIQQETLLITDPSGYEQPVSVETTYPVYKGAVVVCQGAGRASVKLDIIRAVSSLTGLGSDKIAVIKMKGF